MSGLDEVKILEVEIEELQSQLSKLEDEIRTKRRRLMDLKHKDHKIEMTKLTRNEIVRYSRQMFIPWIQSPGQLRLKNSKVLIVGVGGLGCPAALYLTAAGVGSLTLLDYDTVELSNLHRQILHSETDTDIPKVQSAYEKLTRINGNIEIIPMKILANSESLLRLVTENKYDVIVDGSDNVPTRYLLNDVCVMNGIPLVSGSALKDEGQLTVYHHNNGPCYRCLFPVPPPPHTVTNCGDGGVLGTVPGVIGVLQALETIKIITATPGVLSGRLLVFNGSTSEFRNIKLRQRSQTCDVCGENPTISKLIDYEQFCGASAHDKVTGIDILHPRQHINVKELTNIQDGALIVDVRPEIEYDICHLPNTLNYPFTKIERNVAQFAEFLECMKNRELVKTAYILCRRGNDSQRTIALLAKYDIDLQLFNIKGGLHAYANLVDPSFPVY